MMTSLARYAGWLILGLTLILASVGFGLQIMTGSRLLGEGPPVTEDLLSALALAVWAFVGALLISRQPRNPFGWIFALTALVSIMDQFAFGVAYYGFVLHPGSLPGVELVILWLYWGSRVVIIFPLTLLLLLFPTGRPLSPTWGKLIWFSGIVTLLGVLASAISPLPNPNPPFPTNLLGFGRTAVALTRPVS